MIIDYQVLFSVEKFERGEYRIATRWAYLMQERMIEEYKIGYSEDTRVYTSELGDLISFGEWLISSGYCPINVSVQINELNYLYGPEGDLYKLSDKSGPDVIKLSNHFSQIQRKRRKTENVQAPGED